MQKHLGRKGTRGPRFLIVKHRRVYRFLQRDSQEKRRVENSKRMRLSNCKVYPQNIHKHSYTYECGLLWWLSGKDTPAMQEIQEMQVQSLGWEDPLEEDMATHPSILVRNIPWTENPGRLQSMGLQSWTRLK